MLKLQQNENNKHIVNIALGLCDLHANLNIFDDIEQTKNNMTEKKTIYLNDDKTKPVIAVGILIYKNVCDKMKLLIVYTKNRYEDIGGKIDQQDNTIYDTACRKIEEKTNGLIRRIDIINRIQNSQYIYIPKSKYLIFLLEASVYEQKLQKDDFGNIEINNKNNRLIGWIDRKYLSNKNVLKFKLNLRIKNKRLLDTLLSIENQFKFKKKLF